MLFKTLFVVTFLSNSTLNLITDPLEQFDVLSLSLPLLGGGLTNLALLLGLNILLMAA